MPSIKARFPGGSGHMLDGRLEMPDTPPKAYAICCHCFTCNKDTLTSYRISKAMAKKGYATLRFDFTGLGGSEGIFSQTGFSSNVADVLAAIDYLRTHHQAPTLLIGHSLGGTAILEAAIQTEEVKAAVTIASPSQPSHVLHHFDKALAELETGQNSEIIVAGTAYPVKPQFVTDVRNYDLQKRLSDFNKNLLSIRAGKDTLVADKDADEIIKYTTGQHELFDIDNADHLFSNRVDTETMINNTQRRLHLFRRFDSIFNPVLHIEAISRFLVLCSDKYIEVRFIHMRHMPLSMHIFDPVPPCIAAEQHDHPHIRDFF